MSFELARCLRVGEAKHRDQGEFLLLAGDILAQTGDFAAALAKFEMAAEACVESAESASDGEGLNTGLKEPTSTASSLPKARSALPTRDSLFAVFVTPAILSTWNAFRAAHCRG
jgi:hypothetical protein